MKLQLTIISLFFLLCSCATWISEDISDETIVLLAPANNLSDSLQTKNFVWEEIEGALSYRLQIVSPSFDSISFIELDSLTTRTSFESTLAPGLYQWRVRGENEDFETLWTTYNFEIESTASLNGQKITNLQPITGTNTNQTSIQFTWNALASAENYFVEILDEQENQVNINNVVATNYTYNFINEGLYTISIQGLNNISASLNEETKVLIDTTRPPLPTLIFPSFDTLQNFPQTFTWTTSSNTGSTITENLLVATDSLMNNVLLDTTITGATEIALDSINTTGRLYWKVLRQDAAGNTNETVLSKRFFIF